MTKSNPYLLDFKIDKLTDSILNRISGDSFRTEISLVTKSDLKTIAKTKGWLFDWKYEVNQVDREVYKLTILDNTDIVQGLISLAIKTDHVYMYLLESAPFNYITSLGAYHFGGQLMVIDTIGAKRLVDKYFKP
jgi:hypothetical protein